MLFHTCGDHLRRYRHTAALAAGDVLRKPPLVLGSVGNGAEDVVPDCFRAATGFSAEQHGTTQSHYDHFDEGARSVHGNQTADIELRCCPFAPRAKCH